MGRVPEGAREGRPPRRGKGAGGSGGAGTGGGIDVGDGACLHELENLRAKILKGYVLQSSKR